MPIILEDLESDDTALEADFSDFCAGGMKHGADSLDDLKASSKATTHSILPLLITVISRVMRAELRSSELGDVETEMTVAENGCNSKRGARKKRRQSK